MGHGFSVAIKISKCEIAHPKLRKSYLVSVMVINPLSFSCFSNTFRQPPHSTSSQPCRQADAAGPAESYRLCPGFPHGGRRRVTKGPLKFGVYFLSHLPLPHLS